MQQFEAGEQPQHVVTDTVGTGIVGDRAPAPVGERGAQPLAAAQDEVLERGDQAVIVVADVCGGGPAVAEIAPQLRGDGRSQFDG